MSDGDFRDVLVFETFVLDLSRCTLRRDTREFPLRPKSFEVFRHLAERPGRLISKEQIFATVWSNVSVTDDSLVQCIKEIRQALGEERRHLLKTLPRRGYLLDARPVQKSMDSALRDEAGKPPPSHQDNTAFFVRFIRSMAFTSHRMRTLRRPAVIVAALLFAVGIIVFVIRAHRPTANTTAAHYAILGTELVSKRTANDNREAFGLFNKALALDPHNVVALAGYARVLVNDLTEGFAPPQERTIRLDQAETALRHALEIDANHPGARLTMGHLWRVRGKPERAIPELEHSLRLAPNNAWARSELGRNRLELGDSEGAIRELEIAMLVAPHEPAKYIWYFQAGMAAVHAKDGAAALKWFQKSDQASSEYRYKNMIWRAVALADLDRDEEARSFIAEYSARLPSISVASWRENLLDGSPKVALQRDRIAEVLRRLGVPNDRLEP